MEIDHGLPSMVWLFFETSTGEKEDLRLIDKREIKTRKLDQVINYMIFVLNTKEKEFLLKHLKSQKDMSSVSGKIQE
jgi:hypothetical protein